MSTVPVRSATRNRLILSGVDWRTYTRLLRAFEERPNVRLTYDRGTLEIMSPLYKHDHDAEMLGQFVRIMTEELDTTLAAGGSVTLRRRKKMRGLEPDRCYWIANEPRIRGKDDIDLRIDPPPDLAIEVDATHSSLPRVSIYETLGVPELWRLHNKVLTFRALGADGHYAQCGDSPTFAAIRLTPADLMHFLAMRNTQDDNAITRQFRAWVRQRIAPQQPAGP
jgi:Uma2 family endonuclease